MNFIRNALATLGALHALWFAIGATDMIDYHLCIKAEGQCDAKQEPQP